MSIEKAMADVALYRERAAQRPDVFRPDLAMSLNKLATELSGLGRHKPALAPAEEAVGLYRDLAAQDPDRFRPGLAISLDTLVYILRGLGRHDRALAASEEAVALYRELAARRDTIALYRKLAAQRPDPFQGGLAMALASRAHCLDALERTEEALVSTVEAMINLSPLFVDDPTKTGPQMTRLLRQYRRRCERLGRDPTRELLAHPDIDQLGPILLLLDQFVTDQGSEAERDPET